MADTSTQAFLPTWAKVIVQTLGFASLLVAPLVFGWYGKPAEAGVALVAGSLALVFSGLDRFESFGGAGFSAKLRTLTSDVAALKEKQTEPPPKADEVAAADIDKGAAPIDNESRSNQIAAAVLRALDHPDYTWRYMRGLVSDTRYPEFEVRRALGFLVSLGYARTSMGEYGPIWNITEKARSTRLPDGTYSPMFF